MTVGYFIKALTPLYKHDGTEIYNIQHDEDILDNIIMMKENIEKKPGFPMLVKGNLVKQLKKIDQSSFTGKIKIHFASFMLDDFKASFEITL